MSAFLLGALASIVGGIVLLELKGGLPLLARHIVRRAARRLPAPQGSRWRDEWLDHLDHLDLGPASELVYALRIYVDAFKIDADLRPQRSPAALSRDLYRRVLELAGAAIALIVLAPLMVAIAVAIRIDSAGPLLMRQLRIRRNGRTFALYRFRTVDASVAEREPPWVWIPASKDRFPSALMELDGANPIPADDPRVTRVGRYLRRTSLDEVPKLYNVLRGDLRLDRPSPRAADSSS